MREELARTDYHHHRCSTVGVRKLQEEMLEAKRQGKDSVSVYWDHSEVDRKQVQACFPSFRTEGIKSSMRLDCGHARHQGVQSEVGCRIYL